MIPVGFFASLYIPFSKDKLCPGPPISLQIVDRNSVLLREVLSDEGGRCRWAKLDEISPCLIKATVAAEDKHFFLHKGVNLFSVLRAVFQNIKQGRIVSGASTITQQLVRNLYQYRRNIFSKVYEIWLALRMERSLAKEDILAQYLNRICFGNQAYGIEAASHLYFDKNSSDLSLAEAAFLAGLPRSPIKLNPYRNFTFAQKRQREILDRMHRIGFISKDELGRALEERINIQTEQEKFRAPHFCDFILQKIPSEERRHLSTIQTTLDYSLQKKVEVLIKSHIESLESRGISNAAAIVMDNDTGEILSMVGSKDFFDYDHGGQVNGAVSLRQPGSTLKPFTYGLALEKGMTAATIIEDAEMHFTTPEGVYRPKNYDRRFHGPIRMRSALACSYNVPAVSVLQTIGPDLLYLQLKKLGFESLQKSPSFYGIGLTLGNGEVTLLELVGAYAALARGGISYEDKSILGLFDLNQKPSKTPNRQRRKRIFSPQIAYILSHILSDNDARTPSFGQNSPLNFPFPCAAKTGTSKDFRDNWTIGYTLRYTVGVWVGNFDGKPMQEVSGITGCGPLFRDIMLHLENKEKKRPFRVPDKLVREKICPLTGEIASESCPGSIEEIFIVGTKPEEVCLLHQKSKFLPKQEDLLDVQENPAEIRISFPANGDVFKMDPVLRKAYQAIWLKVSVQGMGIERIEWWVNNKKIGASAFPFSFPWQLKPGFYTIKAKASKDKEKIETHPVKITILS